MSISGKIKGGYLTFTGRTISKLDKPLIIRFGLAKKIFKKNWRALSFIFSFWLQIQL
jgi:hypothetical protein